jgi:hypothetical protein
LPGEGVHGRAKCNVGSILADLRELRCLLRARNCDAGFRELTFENKPDPGTPDGDRFDVLLTLVEAYEAKNFPAESLIRPSKLSAAA